MADVFPSSSFVDVPPLDSSKVATPTQGGTVSTFADIQLHHSEWRFLRSVTKSFGAAAGSSGARSVDPESIVATHTVRIRVNPRATQLWVWIDGRSGFATWSSTKNAPDVRVELWDDSSGALLDAGYDLLGVDGTLVGQSAGVPRAEVWDQRYVFGGDKTAPGSVAPRRLDIPEAYWGGRVLYVKLTVSAIDVRAVTVAEAYQISTPQEL